MINVQLTTDSRSLSEVVVTGVGVATSKKKAGDFGRIGDARTNYPLHLPLPSTRP